MYDLKGAYKTNNLPKGIQTKPNFYCTFCAKTCLICFVILALRSTLVSSSHRHPVQSSIRIPSSKPSSLSIPAIPSVFFWFSFSIRLCFVSRETIIFCPYRQLTNSQQIIPKSQRFNIHGAFYHTHVPRSHISLFCFVFLYSIQYCSHTYLLLSASSVLH